MFLFNASQAWYSGIQSDEHQWTRYLNTFTYTYVPYDCVCVCVCVSHSIVSDSLRPIDCSPPGSSVHGILQARILEWVSMPFSRVPSWPRDWTQVSRIAGRRFTVWATREVPKERNPICTGRQDSCKKGKSLILELLNELRLHSVPPLPAHQ